MKMDKMELFFIGAITLFIILILTSLIDNSFMIPMASQKANEICQEKGFDQFLSYERIGFFSTHPIAVKCQYAEKYTDLGVQTNEQN
jgi:hypothetical protein